MRYCEAGACIKQAVYRGAPDSNGAKAWCEEHVEREGDADQPRSGIELIPTPAPETAES